MLPCLSTEVWWSLRKAPLQRQPATLNWRSMFASFASPHWTRERYAGTTLEKGLVKVYHLFSDIVRFGMGASLEGAVSLCSFFRLSGGPCLHRIGEGLNLAATVGALPFPRGYNVQFIHERTDR